VPVYLPTKPDSAVDANELVVSPRVRFLDARRCRASMAQSWLHAVFTLFDL
jgi:hypothetical protein